MSNDIVLHVAIDASITASRNDETIDVESMSKVRFTLFDVDFLIQNLVKNDATPTSNMEFLTVFNTVK